MSAIMCGRGGPLTPADREQVEAFGRFLAGLPPVCRPPRHVFSANGGTGDEEIRCACGRYRPQDIGPDGGRP